MKKSLTLLLALLFSAGLGFAQSWSVDKSHSGVSFEISHMVVSTVEGDFKKFDISIEQGDKDWSNSSVSATIDVNTINTDNEKRDGHLKSEDFFNTAEYPNITFKSSSFKKTEDNQFEITGKLTMHGVTKEVTFNAKHNGTVKDPWGSMRSGWKVTTEVDRTEFGLKYNSALEAGGVMIGEDVEITVNVELVQG